MFFITVRLEIKSSNFLHKTIHLTFGNTLILESHVILYVFWLV